jgi:two-component system, sensor histidine kinase and response regulator
MSDSIKFLLVDDVEENLVALAALLQQPGLEIFQARSATEALELLLVHDFAIAILDVQMPEMDGFELAELMRGPERSRHVPIIFVTAGARDQHRVFKGYESGAVDFLFKPIDPAILRHKAAVFFELYRQRQQLAREIEARDRLVTQLSETLRLNEMFYAALGHDLRNPLSAIVTGATLLKHRSADQQTGAVAGRILTSASRIGTMIDQLLDLARARLAGGIPVTPASVDLQSLAEKIIGEHPPGHRPPVAFEAVGDLQGVWDGSRLAQVLSNLVSNALQHGRADDQVRIRIDGRTPAEVLITVSNGGTIDPAILPHLFEPFRSGRQPNRESDGLGLGLYIVEQVVKGHHGAIHVRSTEREGTTFEVRLPRHAASSHAQADVRRQAEPV